MITNWYLLSTTSRSSSIGGLMMPSAAPRVWVPATSCLPPLLNGSLLHQGYQLAAHVRDGRVDQHDVELVGGGHLLLGDGEPARHHLGRLGAAAGEPAHQLFPGRRGEEDHAGVRYRALDLARPVHVDLQQGEEAGLEPFLDRRARRARPLAAV